MSPEKRYVIQLKSAGRGIYTQELQFQAKRSTIRLPAVHYDDKEIKMSLIRQFEEWMKPSDFRPGAQFFRSVFVFMAVVSGAASPAHAQIYKWIDENGVTHYSSVAPEKSKTAARRLDTKVLEVPRAKTTMAATKPGPVQGSDELSDKVEALERQIEIEREARQAADAQNQATQAAYAQALVEQQAAHNIGNVGYVPTIPVMSGVMVLAPPRHNHAEECHPGSMGNCLKPMHWQRPTPDKTH